MKLVILILIIAGGFYYYQSQGSSLTIDSAKLHPSVPELKKDIATRKLSKDDIRKLSNAFYKSSNSEAKHYTMRLLSLALLAVDPASFPKFKNKINRDYPNEDYLSFIDSEFSNPCSSCDGQGSSPCAKCKGTAKCTNQKCDEGRIKYQGVKEAVNNACPVCRGKDECSICIGSGLSNTACGSCKGSGFNNAKAKAESLYRQSLKSL
jgi:hypothetical protein